MDVFGVSRPTIREALRVLESEGLLEIRRGVNGGSFISEPNPDQAGRALEALIRFRGASTLELTEFRANFEADSAWWAAKRATEEEIEELNVIVEQFKQEAGKPSTTWSKLVDLDIAFHEKIAYSTHNQIRIAIMLAIYGIIRKSSLIIECIEDEDWRLQQYTDLLGILEAIKNNDQELARERMYDHVYKNLEIQENIKQKEQDH